MIRLDHLLVKRYPHYSRRQLVTWIEEGKVTVNGRVATKARELVDEAADVAVLAPEPLYVSRAGYKLEKALDYFNITVHDLVALDAGLSTGGFTHCLLKRGVKKVFGVDVGSGQVHPDIRADSRVVVM